MVYQSGHAENSNSSMLGHVLTITCIALFDSDAWLISEDPSPRTIMETKH
jgi:hypothetical protein